MACRMDLEWVDIARCPTTGRRSCSVAAGDVRQVQIPDGKCGLDLRGPSTETCADWNQIDVRGPVYVGGMSRIETGCDNHWPRDDRPELPHLRRCHNRYSIIFEYSDWRWRALAKNLVVGAHLRRSQVVTHFDLQDSPDLADHRCAAPKDVASTLPHQKALADAARHEFQPLQPGRS